MIGIKDTGRGMKNGEMRERTKMNTFSDFSGTFAGERRVFKQAWEHLTYMQMKAKMQKHSLRSYHYTDHEKHVFKMLAQRHAGHKGIPTVAEVEEFFSSDKTIDLHKLVSEQLVWPTLDTTLKTIAGWARFSWRDSAPSGSNSITWVLNAISGPEDERVEWAARVTEYNSDDVSAQVAIRDFLGRLAEAYNDEEKLGRIESLEKIYHGRPIR